MKRLFVLSALPILLSGCAMVRHEAPASYMVFFTSSNTELSADARAVVDQAGAQALRTHAQSIVIAAGVASGDNLKLAQPRFLAVRRALIADGVPDGIIARSALADASLGLGATGDQRVEIRLAGPASNS